MIELSLNEVETLGAKAARGAGFDWGHAEDIGRAACRLACEGQDWGAALLALLAQAHSFVPPSAQRRALWRKGGADAAEAAPLCPVRTAAYLNDARPEFEGPLTLLNLGQPLWLAALLRASGLWRVEIDGAAATLRRSGPSPQPALRRAKATPDDLAALSIWAARLYVPESDNSRNRGAGGGRVDDE